MRRRIYIAAAAIMVLLAASAGYIWCVAIPNGFRNAAKGHDAFVAANLIQACVEYRANANSGNQFPAKLSDLVTPPWGGASLLVGDRKLLDTHSQPFRYALVPDKTGETRPYVWTEYNEDGKTIVLGAKLTENGEVEKFGL